MTPEFSITTDIAGQKKLVAPVFAAFAQAGFTAVHWCQDWIGEPVFYTPDFAQQVTQLARCNGLRVADVHGYGGTAETGIALTQELYLAMNINRAQFASSVAAKTVVLHLPLFKGQGVAEAIETSIATLRSLRPAYEALGIAAAVENLPWPTHQYEFFEALFAEFPREYLGFCYDSGHAVVTGQADLIRRHIDRLAVTHLHDNDGSADQHRMPGQGKADWVMIVRTLRESSYQGTINLELNLPGGRELQEFCNEAHRNITGRFAGGA